MENCFNKTYYLENILHSGKSGTEWEEKKGRNYDLRKNHYCKIVKTNEQDALIINLFEDRVCDEKSYFKSIMTTPFVSFTKGENEKLYLRTENSIYVLREA